MTVKHIDCEDYVSVCCGAGSNEYVEEFCNACNEYAEFECIECTSPKEPAKCPQCKYTPILNGFNYCPMCVFSLGNHVGKTTSDRVKKESGDYSVGKGFELL